MIYVCWFLLFGNVVVIAVDNVLRCVVLAFCFSFSLNRHRGSDCRIASSVADVCWWVSVV